MSVQLFEADYISVIGEKGVKNYVSGSFDGKTKETKEEQVEFIKLFFTLQVNGKLKTFDSRFEVEDNQITISKSLKNWNEWYTLYEALKGIGYELCEEPSDLIVSSIMNTWLEKLFKD